MIGFASLRKCLTYASTQTASVYFRKTKLCALLTIMNCAAPGADDYLPAIRYFPFTVIPGHVSVRKGTAGNPD